MLRDAGDVGLEVCPRIGVRARRRGRQNCCCQQGQSNFYVSISCFHRIDDCFFCWNNRSDRCWAAHRKSNAVVTFQGVLAAKTSAVVTRISVESSANVPRQSACRLNQAHCSDSVRWRTGRPNFQSADRITNVTHGVNQRRITNFSSQPSDENLDQLRVVFVCVFPDAFAKLRAREDTARLPHQHL